MNNPNFDLLQEWLSKKSLGFNILTFDYSPVLCSTYKQNNDFHIFHVYPITDSFKFNLQYCKVANDLPQDFKRLENITYMDVLNEFKNIIGEA